MMMAQHNNIVDDIEAITGLMGVTPRYNIPQPRPVIAARGPMTFNNISANNSVVGAINTGNVKRIDVAIERIKQQGSAAAVDFADSLKTFTEATLQAEDLDKPAKDEMMEHLSFLTDQIHTKPAERKPGMIARTLTNLSTAVSASNGLVALWPHLHHLFNSVFRIG